VKQDFKEAKNWFLLIAPQGHINSQIRLGEMHDTGLGEPENYAEAMRWFKLAATHGSAEAQSKVGFMYGNAHGVELNFPESLRWYLWQLSKSTLQRCQI
jgi:TPR repeat protein